MQFDWIEIIGALTGIIYLILEIKGNLWLWPIGLLNAIFYTIVFFNGGLYAITTLQIYYVAINIYGWIHWWKNGDRLQQTETDQSFPIQKVKGIMWLYISVAVVLLWLAYYFLLARLTDSQVPVWDAMTTAFSFVGTWMLAKKYIQQWYIWIGVDIFSVGLYYSQGLTITAILYGVYAVLACMGLMRWKKMKATQCAE